MSNVAVVEAARLPYPEAAARMGVESSAWQTLVNATFPTARTAEGVILALNYCRARSLDVFKRPVHIVPIRTKLKSPDGKEYWADIETVWPGINELRTTAHRTGVYAGSDPAGWGPDITSEWELPSGDDGDDHPNAPPREKKAAAAPVRMLKVVHPEWCQITVYRIVQGQRVAFPGPRVYWLETYATAGKSDRPNEMWKDRARGQLEKCAEAAALRKAFPEELGGEHIVEEAPRMVEINPAAAAPEKRPDRTEIDAKAKPPTKAIEASKADRSAPIQSKPAGETVVLNGGETLTHGKVVLPPADAKPEPTKNAELGEALEHALKVLDKLTVDEIAGARASVRKELSADDFAVWNTRSFERERELRGRR
jgi:phage recombination protein Bet